MTIVIAALLAAVPASAQQQDAELWLTGNAALEVARNTSLTLEVIGRFSDRDGLYELEAGAVIDREIADGVTLSLGHFYVPGYDDGDFDYGEQRPRQQIAFPIARLGRARFDARVRTEQRFRTDGSDVGVRIRPQLRFRHPLGSGDGAPVLSLSHEAYVNLNDTDWGQIGGYERMRNTLSVSVPLGDRLELGAGYLNQYRLAQGGGRDRMDHVLSLALSLDL